MKLLDVGTGVILFVIVITMIGGIIAGGKDGELNVEAVQTETKK